MRPPLDLRASHVADHHLHLLRLKLRHHQRFPLVFGWLRKRVDPVREVVEKRVRRYGIERKVVVRTGLAEER